MIEKERNIALNWIERMKELRERREKKMMIKKLKEMMVKKKCSEDGRVKDDIRKKSIIRSEY